MRVKRSGKAPPPNKATIAISPGSLVVVRVEAHAANPLTPPGAPEIDYEYSLYFNLKTGDVHVIGKHDTFPWHELYVTIDNVPPAAIQVRDVPSGPTKTPIDLSDWFPPKFVNGHAVVPALVK